MQELKKLDELAVKMAQKNYLIKKRKHIANELALMAQEDIRLQSQSKKETNDYESIEKLSIKKLLKLFSDDYEEKIDKEYREMKIARYKYDLLLDKIKSAQAEISGINELLTYYEHVDQEYTTLLNAKRLWANQNGVGSLENYDSEIINLEIQKKEIDEAASACKKLILSLSSAKEDLSSAKNWGIFDVLGGGLIPSLVKQDHIKRASQYIKDSSEKASYLMRELSDLRPYFDIEKVEIDALATTFDTFFDNIFSDLTIQDQIDSAYDNICHNFEIAESLQEKLVLLSADSAKQIEIITAKRNEVVLAL